MKTTASVVIALGVSLCSAWANAATRVVAATSGTYPDGADTDCVPDPTYAGSVVVSEAAGYDCWVQIPIELDAGKVITRINFYYFDNWNTQYMHGKLVKKTIGTGSSSILNWFTDTATASGIQWWYIDFNTTMTSSSAYYVDVHIQKGTRFDGIKIEYQ